jgi:hypothetical protein
MKYSKLYSLRAPDVGYLTLNLIENSSGLSNVLLKSGTTVILIKTVTRWAPTAAQESRDILFNNPD